MENEINMNEEEETINIDANELNGDEMDQDEEKNDYGVILPNFPPLAPQRLTNGESQYARVRVPPHRLTPLKTNWEILIKPIIEHLKLQIRYNPKSKSVELKTCEFTTDISSLQRGGDYIQAFLMGFELQDAIALMRMDDLFIDSFEIKDVKNLQGDHLSRAIGRIAGQDGKTKFAIENATRTRIVLQDQKIHILGTFSNIKIAKDAICALILGAPPGKVYNNLKNVAKRLNERL